ncbi:hypothetical protein SAY87_023937 [Trapa incisa]|uniref:Uncharacterized protein n=1 Tax=Trapa incisa TaxID=236973 RepID=A0AAN7KZF6_9MYRT|nr:hypothetical protein SAY87_023937 [Trapa incisa]
MEDFARKGSRGISFASRKAEETAWRLYQAVGWLGSVVGPLGLSSQPSETEFISCLRNGQVLCNAINKVHPGAVPKVVENNPAQKTPCGETQPLHAYQYFENVKNFLVAIEELKLPAFEASDLERDNFEAGSSAKVVDCILGLKAYHERKQVAGCGNGLFKHTRSPMVTHSVSRNHAWGRAPPPPSSDSFQCLDMPSTCQKQQSASEERVLEESLVRMLANYMAEAKENFDGDLLSTLSNGNIKTVKDPVKFLGKIVSTCVGDPQLNAVFEEYYAKRDRSSLHSAQPPLGEHSSTTSSVCRRSCLRKGNCNHWQKFQMQERELSAIKNLLTKAKTEFDELQRQLQRDIQELGVQVQEMSMAALGYHQVVKENRDLYNMVQDLKGNIRVYCRIRPIFNEEARSIVDFIGQDDSLVISDPSKPQREGRKIFKFNKVFGPTSSQNDIYADTQPLIRSVMDGYNVCIFAYGQTGSGKTHTMSCPSGGLANDMGINHLALNDLFHLSSMRKDIAEYEIQVQMVEIYNEQVRDLLAEDSSNTKYPFMLKLLEIRSCTADGGLSLPDATMHSVKSTADVIKLMKLGDDNRVISSTVLNNRSSRSHSILTVHVSGKDISGCTLRSCLHLIDLAGSERVDKSEVTGERLKEAQYINKSLSCLGDVITSLAQKNSHIPYRNSKLTLLLQHSLGGHAKTLMFAHINPERDSFGETISTLKFAQRVSSVELGAARMNKENSEVMQLKEQVENLKAALANKRAQSVQLSSTRHISSVEKPKAYLERTPPRPRRLSIENCTSNTAIKYEKSVNCEERKTKTPGPIRLRRLSIEGLRMGEKDGLQVQVSGGDMLTPRNGDLQEEFHRRKAPQSPASITKKQVAKMKSKQRATTNEVLKTPEPSSLLSRNGVRTQMQSDLNFFRDTQTPNSMISKANGKGSHIRKSLRTIGKLISVSEKRTPSSRQLRDSAEVPSPITGSSVISSNGRASRRQSLTGIPLPGGAELRSRRSSLGDVNRNDTRTAKTPPPVHQSSSNTTKRWL